MKHCLRCNRLEWEYQHTIAGINSVVAGRFNSVGEKLRELFGWQDVRDKSVEAFYDHKKTHATEHKKIGVTGASDVRMIA
jgi:hypothetical protein